MKKQGMWPVVWVRLPQDWIKAYDVLSVTHITSIANMYKIPAELLDQTNMNGITLP